MKNTKGFTLTELALAIAISVIFATSILHFFINNDDDVKVIIKEKEKFSQNNLYSPDEKKLGVKSKKFDKVLFHAESIGKMSCEGCSTDLKVYEFCYNGIKYFAIEGGYMAPKMIKASNGVIHHETCD